MGRVLLRYAAETAEHCIRVNSRCREAEHCADEKLSELFLPALQGIWRLPKGCAVWRRRMSWDELSLNFLQTLTFPRRGTLRGYEEDRQGTASCCAARPRGIAGVEELFFFQTARHAGGTALPIRCSVT